MCVGCGVGGRAVVLAVLGLGRSLLCLLLHLRLSLGLVVAHAREAAPAARVLCTRAATCTLRAVRDAGPQGVGWECVCVGGVRAGTADVLSEGLVLAQSDGSSGSPAQRLGG